jgi:hypothetical protein
MYSVKHREGGVETIKSVESVAYDSKRNEFVGTGCTDTKIAGGTLRYTSGVVFVTNEAGQTIGIYNLKK